MPIFIQRLPVLASAGIPRCNLYLWVEDGYVPVDEFLTDLGKSRSNDFNRLYKLFKMMVENGRIANSENFKDVEGYKPLFEFKGHGVRVYCFRDGDDWILVEGDDDKKSDSSRKRNKQCIARAERRQELYWQEKNAGKLEVRK